MNGEIPIPSYLKGYVADCTAKDDVVTAVIADSKGNKLFEIWYYAEYADWCKLYIDMDGIGAKFVARSVGTGEEILLFDEKIHGYDNMFCNEPDNRSDERTLAKLDIPPTEITVKLGYGIDYDDEKESYDFDENGNCILINRSAIPWSQVKTDGIDWITLYYKDEKGRLVEFTEAELA